MSSMGNSGARSCGPIGCLVPGWSTGGAGVLRSAWMLYHLVGMSFSSSRNLVRFLSVALVAISASFGGTPCEKCANHTEPGPSLSMRRPWGTLTSAMPPTLKLPRRDGTLTRYTLSGRTPVLAPPGPIRSRIGMAGGHGAADPLASINPSRAVALDWDATLRFRHPL